MRRLWLVPHNDAESVTIIGLLARNHERFLVTNQRWGASWRGIEWSIAKFLADFRREWPFSTIYGVELIGNPPNPYTVNIDHHRYKDDDRRNPDSSLEQVASILECGLTAWERAIAINDRGYLPELEKIYGFEGKKFLERVREFDRRCQGVSVEQDRSARRLVSSAAADKGEGRWTLQVPDLINSAHSDFLYLDCGAREWLIESPEQWLYSGPRATRFSSQPWPENHWSGGATESGFFVIERPSPTESQTKLHDLFLS
jgi:hypothetical protein